MIGLGVMGQNLLLNVADHGFSAIGFDLDEKKDLRSEAAATKGTYESSWSFGRPCAANCLHQEK